MKKNKIKRFVLKTVTGIAWIVFILSICALDSPNFVLPVVCLAVSMAWLAVFSWANGYMDSSYCGKGER
jgi:hypothetical protein